MEQQEDNQRFHRKEENRAHSKDSRKSQKIPVSHFLEEIKPGRTLWGYQFSQGGMISDLTISVDYHKGDLIPLNVEIGKEEGVFEIQRAIDLGENEFHSHSVEKGDKLVIKSREIENVEYSARNVFISFNLVIGGKNA